MKRLIDRKIRHERIRAKIKGTSMRPRLSVFRSHKHIAAQLIDDEAGKTLVMKDDFIRSEKKTEKDAKTKEKKSEPLAIRAKRVGEDIAKAALAKKISTVVFDRGGYRYHGIVKALAEGARKGGLKF